MVLPHCAQIAGSELPVTDPGTDGVSGGYGRKTKDARLEKASRRSFANISRVEELVCLVSIHTDEPPPSYYFPDGFDEARTSSDSNWNN